MKFDCYLIIAVLCFSGYSSHLAAENAKPNIVVIYTDDQGYGDVSALNPESKFETPNLDRLANEGIAFTHGHSADSVCTPSRYGLLTGRYPWRTHLKRGVFGAEKECLIEDGRMTLASLLKQNGYDTAMVGKWHLGMDFPGTPDSRDWSQPVRDMPLDKGFDYFYGIPASLNYGVLAWFEGRHAKVPPTLYTNKKTNPRHVDYRIMPPFDEQPTGPGRHIKTRGFEIAPDFIDNQCLTRFTDKAIQWMQEKSSDEPNQKPFFLYLPFTSPHYPVCPLPEFHGKGEAGAYGEFVIETDHHVGRVMKFLEDSGLDENTLIVFTSDNGPEKSWSGRIDEFSHDSRGGYRGGKRSVYEGGHRVPFLVRWPAGIKQPGRQCDEPVGQVDLLATVAELVGVPLPDDAGEDSDSFAAVLRDPDTEHQRLPLVTHANGGNEYRYAITHRDWKLVFRDSRHDDELYNLAIDAAETKNVAAEHPDLIHELTEKMNQIITRGRTTPGPAQPNDTGYWEDLHWMEESAYTLTNHRENPKQPNIIFLFADDQSTYSVGCYGNPDVQTPNMDKLARDGVVFDRHYNTTAICMASRANVFTGMYEYKTGTNFTHGDMKAEVWAKSYPVLLRQAGYLTAFAGKFGIVVDGKGLCESDFDFWGGGPGQTDYVTARNRSMKKYAKDYPHSTLSYGAFGQDVIRESVKQAKPFCLSISFKAPHKPASPDPRFNEVYAGKTFTKPKNFGRAAGEHLSPQSKQGRQYPRFTEWKYDTDYDEEMRKYHQQVHAIDVALGMIRDEVQAQGIADNTVIVYTSDNGYICGSHGYGSKVLPMEESSRVPLMIYDPRSESSGKGQRCSALTGNIDFAPTILELAGLPIPENMDGVSLLPILENPALDVRDQMAFMNVYGDVPTTSLTCLTKDWKYTYWWYGDSQMEPTEELFNIGSDPLELTNLSADPESQSKLDSMRNRYDVELGKWKQHAVSYNDYQRYGELFDRTIPWQSKNSKKPRQSKKKSVTQ